MCRNSMESSSVSMRSVVFGALDGLTTSLAVLGAAAGKIMRHAHECYYNITKSTSVCHSISGSGVGSSVVLALGVGSIVADAIALGFGEYMSSKAHMTFVQAQRRHGQWEYKNYREHEIALMTKLFESKGMSKADAEVVVSTMAQYENLFVNLMITEERGLIIPRETEFELCTDAFMMFISFAFFGSVPLLCFWACEDALGTSATHAFLIAAFVALVMLAAFGCIKGSFRYSTADSVFL